MVRSWSLWAIMALALSPLVAGAEEEKLFPKRNESSIAVDASSLHCAHQLGNQCYDHCFVDTSCQVYLDSQGAGYGERTPCTSTVTQYKTTVTQYKTTVTEYKTTVKITVTDTTTATTTTDLYTTVPTTTTASTTIPTTTTKVTTKTVSLCSYVPETTIVYGQAVVRRTNPTCVFSTIVSTLTITTTYTTVKPTTTTTTKPTTTTKTKSTTTTTTKPTTTTTTKPTTTTKTKTETSHTTASTTTTSHSTTTTTTTSLSRTTTTTTRPTTTTETAITTLPASTTVITTTSFSLSITTVVLPPITVTFTREGSTFMTTIPGTTTTRTETITLAPETHTIATVTVSPAPACPAPTSSGLFSRSSSAKSNLKWGCKPGFVCSPPKPEGCQVWGSAPPRDYVCKPQHCIPAPPLKPVRWAENQTGYYPPNPGYFNFDPRAFGLSEGIFEKTEIIEVVNGETKTVTTGDWTSQASQTMWPPQSPTSGAAPQTTTLASTTKPKKAKRSAQYYRNLLKRGFTTMRRRQIAGNDKLPSVCYSPCNNAFREAQAVGKVPALCLETSAFNAERNSCLDCITVSANQTMTGPREYLINEFVDYLDYCESSAGQPGSTGPPAQVTSPGDIGSTSQGAPGTTGAPVPITTPSTSSTSSTTSTTSGTTTPTSTGSSSTGTSSTSTAPPTTSGPTTPPVVNGTTSRPPSITTAGAVSSHQSVLTALFITILASFFVLQG